MFRAPSRKIHRRTCNRKYAKTRFRLQTANAALQLSSLLTKICRDTRTDAGTVWQRRKTPGLAPGLAPGQFCDAGTPGQMQGESWHTAYRPLTDE